MNVSFDQITSCYMGPELSPEHFVQEHMFLFLAKGRIEGYDGKRTAVLQSGQYCIVCKNHLARYNKQEEAGGFEKVAVVFEEAFLKRFQEKYAISCGQTTEKGAFYILPAIPLIPSFLQSLLPYYQQGGRIQERYAVLKREELLLILLEAVPQLADILFDFGTPQKINLEAFMNRHYKFNVSLERLAYMTGRSLSAFKRDFERIFQDTPGRWLMQKRLQEAFFLITRKRLKPSAIYLDLGFEDLSHFSFAFKKRFGVNASELLTNR